LVWACDWELWDLDLAINVKRSRCIAYTMDQDITVLV